ncbi:MAG: MOSC domain-containing protein [Cyclobacteriaceae bacterium]|nr:MOSC domain-containing protein [Cyclobacteriaceae bacterium]
MARLTLSEIWIYPIKSFAGIRISKARVKQKGLEFDRRLMLVDEANRFITQREHPIMARFRLYMEAGKLTVESLLDDSHASIAINLEPRANQPTFKVTIWDDEVEAMELNPTYSDWFSTQLKMKCRLVCFPENNVRDVDPAYVENKAQVSLADGYPFLIIGQSSLDNLNSKLVNQIEMNRFRPNFVFTGGKPHEEDTWKTFSIGSNRFRGVKLCARCVLTTVNPQTGIKGHEPLATLATYRKQGSKILFGQNLVAINYEEVSEGDEIVL